MTLWKIFNLLYIKLTRKHTKEERRHLINELVNMGFRSAHADEALDYSADKTVALDWLCKLRKLKLNICTDIFFI